MKRGLGLSIKGTIRFGLLFAVAMWLWRFFGSYLLFAAMVVMLGGMAVSALLLWFSRDGFCANAVIFADRVGKNSPFSFEIQIENPGRFTGFGAELVFSWGNVFTDSFYSEKERLWIAPHKGAVRQGLLESRYAGRLEVRIDKFVVYDMFHIFCLKNCSKNDAWTVAAPADDEGVEEEIYSYVEGFPKENESKKRGTDYNPDYEIREYIPGDELKNIHWKLTAKQNKPMVRERLAAGREKINVFLPLGDDKDKNDEMMDAFYALCGLLIKKDYPVQLFWAGKEETLRTCCLAEQGELWNAVSEILSSSGINFSDSAKERMRTERPGEDYILIQTGAYKGAYIRQE